MARAIRRSYRRYVSVMSGLWCPITSDTMASAMSASMLARENDVLKAPGRVQLLRSGELIVNRRSDK